MKKKKVLRIYKDIIDGHEVEVKVYEPYTEEEFKEEERKRQAQEQQVTLLNHKVLTEIDKQKIKKLLRRL